MVTIQTRELEVLQAKIREAEERLREQESRVASPTRINGRHSPNDDAQGSTQQSNENGEGQEPQARSPMSSPISDDHPSDEGFTDSSTSTATSHNLDEAGSENEHEGKGKETES